MKKGIVATGSQEATQAAIAMLENGGNAVDAAVAAVFTSMTSEFALTGVAGGGAMMVKIAGNDPLLYDFFVNTPSLKQIKGIDFVKATVNFGSSTQNFYIGKGSVAIPGNLAGLVTVQKELGQLPLSVVLEPGIYLSRFGYKMNKEQAYIFRILEPIFCHSSEARQLLFKDNQLLKEGELFVNLDLSNFLERVAREGADFFYKGEIAELMVKTLSHGGLIDYNSLKNYRVIPRKPICTNFQNMDIYSNPPPSAGGSLIIFLLRLLEKSGDHKFPVSKLIHAMSLTNTARHEVCTDPNNESLYIHLLQEDIFMHYMDMFSKKESSTEQHSKLPNRGCTTHVSVIDKAGNCASLTTSNGEGSGYVLPGTGIMLNNMLGEEDLNPMGFHNWGKYRRLATMMSPSIVTRGGKPVMIIGSGGSNRIRSAIVQVLINYIYRGMSLKQSIDEPRLHLEGNKLYHEPGIKILPDDLPFELLPHPFDEKNLFFGGVNAVTTNEGYSDPRRGGTFHII